MIQKNRNELIIFCPKFWGKVKKKVPRSSTNNCVPIDAGLKPIWAVIAEKVLSYAHKTMLKAKHSWVKIAMDENIKRGASSSEYTKYLQLWKIKTNSYGLTLEQIRKTINNVTIVDIMN